MVGGEQSRAVTGGAALEPVRPARARAGWHRAETAGNGRERPVAVCGSAGRPCVRGSCQGLARVRKGAGELVGGGQPHALLLPLPLPLPRTGGAGTVRPAPGEARPRRLAPGPEPSAGAGPPRPVRSRSPAVQPGPVGVRQGPVGALRSPASERLRLLRYGICAIKRNLPVLHVL
ncbi:hypothetical protein GCM10010309_37560 [Streptomyces violaceochromogenes]|nr:hypothetical protein GCM10010309_37560 [Streptomyces violaceochromogenes]